MYGGMEKWSGARTVRRSTLLRDDGRIERMTPRLESLGYVVLAHPAR
jgi:hypothetical protein